MRIRCLLCVMAVLVLVICGTVSAATKMVEWKFENNLDDTSGNGIDGSEFNAPAYTSEGVLDYALVSDGTDCAFVVGVDSNDLPVKADATWTVNAWVCPDDQPGDWNVMWAMGNKPSGSGSATSRAVYCSSLGNIVFTDGSGISGHYLSTGVQWDTGKWQMITTTYDGTNVRVYKNAVLIGTKAFTFVDAPGEFRIPSNPGWNEYMSGKFDELTIWDDALTPAEIADLIIPGVLPPAAMIVYYDMGDPNEAGVLPDHSGNGNDGTFTTASGAIQDWIADGVIGDSLAFDGGQKVTVPATVSQNSQFTVAFWFNAGWQPYTSAFYHEKGADGSEFVIRGDGNKYVKIYSKDQWWGLVFSLSLGEPGVDFSAYLNGTWNHMAVSSDGQSVTLYVNGEIVKTTEYQKSDSKTAMTGYIGYKKDDGGYLGSWADIAYIDEFRSFDGALTQSQVQAMIAESNFDLDLAVDANDLNIMAGDWLADTIISPGSQAVVDDMEGSLSGWSVHSSSTYSGTGTISQTTNAYAGSNALQWTYNLPATASGSNYTSIVFDLGQETDMSVYDELSLWLYRHAGNTSEDLLFFKFYEEGGYAIDPNALKAEAWIQGSACVTDPVDEWDEWSIEIAPGSLRGPYGNGTVDPNAIEATRYILIGTGSEGNTSSRTGTIDIDEIQLKIVPVCSMPLMTDLTGDCIVNLKDFAEFAMDWLLGIY